MLVACRLAGLSALEAHYAGVRVGRAIRGRVAAPPSLTASSSWQRKSEDWHDNSKLGDDGAVTSLGNSSPRRRDAP